MKIGPFLLQIVTQQHSNGHFHCSGGSQQPPRSSGLVHAVEPSLSCPLPLLSPSLISNLASMDVKQHVNG